jgi:hypothetical protein
MRPATERSSERERTPILSILATLPQPSAAGAQLELHLGPAEARFLRRHTFVFPLESGFATAETTDLPPARSRSLRANAVAGRSARRPRQAPRAGYTQPGTEFDLLGQLSRQSDRLAERVGRGLKPGADLGEFSRRQVDALLLYLRALLLNWSASVESRRAPASRQRFRPKRRRQDHRRYQCRYPPI